MIPFNKVKLYENACNASNTGSWYVSNLIERTKEKENVIDFELDIWSLNLDVNVWGEKLSFYDIITHLRQINEVDVNFPVIVNEQGWVMDGWHRIAKSILHGKRYIKAVRFKKNPEKDLFNQTDME